MSVAADDSKFTTIVANLSDTSFRNRRSAQRQLEEIAIEHLNQLESLLQSSTEETAHRIIEVLEVAFLKDDGPTGEAIEKIFQRATQAGGPAAVPAGMVLQRNAYLRESRARVALENLGAQFVYYSPYAAINGRALFQSRAATLPEVGVGFGPAATLYGIYIHEDWKGTKEDLWHFTRLSQHQNLVIYLIRGSSLEINDLFLLGRDLKGLMIEERGACLGIISAGVPSPCVVGEVVAEGAADKGGLQTGDIIDALDDTQVRSFHNLVQMLQDYKVGDEVTFSIFRNNENMTVQVKLGSWRDVVFGNEKTVPSPPLYGGPFDKPKPEEPLPEVIPNEPTPAKPEKVPTEVEVKE